MWSVGVIQAWEVQNIKLFFFFIECKLRLSFILIDFIIIFELSKKKMVELVYWGLSQNLYKMFLEVHPIKLSLFRVFKMNEVKFRPSTYYFLYVIVSHSYYIMVSQFFFFLRETLWCLNCHQFIFLYWSHLGIHGYYIRKNELQKRWE